jgi:hypothetical protein
MEEENIVCFRVLGIGRSGGGDQLEYAFLGASAYGLGG